MYINIEGENYTLDVQKIFEFVFSSQKEKNTENVINQVYSLLENKKGTEPEMKLVNKEMTENKTYGKVELDNIRYDFFKMILDVLLGIGLNQPNPNVIPMNGELIAKKNSFEDISVGEAIIFNTFIYLGWLKPVTSEED